MTKTSIFIHQSNRLWNGKLITLFYFSFLFLAVSLSVNAENKNQLNKTVTNQETVQIKGKVVDDKGEAAIGANVVVKGTAQGTITDINGNYTLKVNPKSTIVISYIGFISQEFTVNGKTVINAKLISDSKNLNEVVVVGYGQVKRANVLGAVTNISSDKIKDMSVTNMAATLQGQLAGVRVAENSGNPTASNQISIRVNTSSNQTNPLFVIDGVIYDSQTPFDNLDPSEVESISVLKDASAAVYGARSAGGVIIVKTKRGKDGKPKISYSGSFGVASATEFTKTLSAYDQATLINDLVRGLNNYDLANGSSLDKMFSTDELEKMKSLNYNWLDEAWKNSYSNRQAVNVRGGGDKIRYFGSGAFFYNSGNFPELYAKKYTLRLGVDVDVTKDLSASLTLTADNRETKTPLNSNAITINGGTPADAQGDYLRNSFAALMTIPKWLPPTINGYDVGQNGIVGNDPLAVFKSKSYGMTDSGSSSIIASLNYNVSQIKGLKLFGTYNSIRGDSYARQLRRNYTLYNFATDGHLIAEGATTPIGSSTIENGNLIRESSEVSTSYQFNTGASYSNEFGRHNFDAMIQYEQSHSNSNGIIGRSDIMIIDNTETQSAFTTPTTTTQRSEGARVSYIGRLNYSYADRYLVESSFRYEASSKLVRSQRWGFFPSISLGWRVSEEPWFKDGVQFIDNLKVRASIGRLGNDGVNGQNQWLLLYTLAASNGPVFGSTISSTLTPNNNGLVTNNTTWEKSNNYNAGIDLKFKNNISISGDAFYVYNYDILQSPVTGLVGTVGVDKAPSVNYGINKSWGYEIELGYNGKFNKDWNYNVHGNLGFATKKVIKVMQNPGVVGTWVDQVGTTGNREEGFIAKGIIRTQEQLDKILDEYEQKYGNRDYKIFGKPAALGMMNYEDVGGANYSRVPDGIIDDNDMTVLSKYGSNPFSFGFQYGMSWKSLSFDLNFGGSFGAKTFYDKSAFSLPDITTSTAYYANVPAFWSDHWTPESPNAKYPAVYQGMGNRRSTFWMVDGTNLRLTAVNLSYSVPSRTFAKLGISQVRVYCNARNLLTLINPFDGYKDYSLALYYSYPMMRTFNFGLNFSL